MEDNKIMEDNNYMATDEVASLLVRLYADFQCGTGNYNDEVSKKYADAIGIAIRMLSD